MKTTLRPTTWLVDHPTPRMGGFPGGVVLTDRPDGQPDVWAYPNIHGDVIITTDAALMVVPAWVAM